MMKNAARGRHFIGRSLLLSVLALLVGDAAACLAGGLAGGLAFAAAAILGALAQVPGLKGLDMFHGSILLVFDSRQHFIILPT